MHKRGFGQGAILFLCTCLVVLLFSQGTADRTEREL